MTTDDRLASALAGTVDGARLRGLPGTAVSVAVRTPSGATVRLHRGTTGRVEPGGEPDDVTGQTLWDLASLTKTYVAVAALALHEDGVVDLDAPVAALVPVGAGPGAASVTLRHLLTHTAGLADSSAAWRTERDPDRLLATVLAGPLTAAPGTAHTYSCLGYIAVGRALEVATGEPLDALVTRRVLRPLGAGTARYGPVPAPAAVATEDQPGRGVVRGAVHDELAHALARPVGNAGLFGTADDVLALGELVLADGVGRAGRVLTAASVRVLREPVAGLPPGHPPYGQAVGFRVADAAFMGGVRGIGHTGFTGTSLVVDPGRGTVAVLLTNRVHPTRAGTDVNPLRRAVADAVAAHASGRAADRPAGVAQALG
ncbi:serine hydrolase domain-containing protein [Cellulomonas sp. ATA003]|uniref:serine hydrolase domain-containing protein n=1 Tax=Cellulomonas sp. ATA003 TaxID=3073064 RepID=UPI002872B5BB|nr:serine hydrolase domain-containing protein [Cellulomonas sp. ATA003]WNB86426.1 serine hydrolase domain-containing protein [Cellulomonas sp. ATA003]